ncbi:hypothetical protein NB851_003375 [Pseudomonas aeruginosa]|uniref:hypothetical protein n=1 Tax=Pseudomonas aeruginosa TaxID=287 RepID=UPI0023B1A8B3|nr:hypothetical protein [Pseudomonas aeruginosa]MDE9397821.1 hypothetical protein [Pseudomonas aeruginosa]
MSENNTPSPANGTPAPAAARTRSALWPVLGIVAALAAGCLLLASVILLYNSRLKSDRSHVVL